MCEAVDVWITHIGGYPGRYNVRVREEIQQAILQNCSFVGIPIF